MIGVSEYLAVEHGEVLRVVLPQSGLEVEEFGADMFSIWTSNEKLSFPSPFSGQVAEVNGEVEINPDIVNESAYDQGWIILLDPHEIDLEKLLEPDEYIEYISEL
jgi:glycine cleavage system H protein